MMLIELRTFQMIEFFDKIKMRLRFCIISNKSSVATCCVERNELLQKNDEDWNRLTIYDDHRTLRRWIAWSSTTWINYLSTCMKRAMNCTRCVCESVGSSLLREWYGSLSTSSEHALNTIVVGWKWYDFLKLVRDGRSINKNLIQSSRVQEFSDVISTWSRFMIHSNEHWHLFKMIVDRFFYSSNIRSFARLIYVSSMIISFIDDRCWDFVNADCQLFMIQSSDHLVS
jgi:hypothetical protein